MSSRREVSPLVGHLRETGQLNAGLVLRSLLSGNIDFFEQALAELAELPVRRVAALVHDRRGAGFKAVYDRAGLPESVIRRSAPRSGHARDGLHAERRQHAAQAAHGRARADELRRHGGARHRAADDLLRRYATEAAREEARLFCDELVDMGNVVAANDSERLMIAAANASRRSSRLAGRDCI